MEIKKNIVIDASPEVVFKAINDPNELTNWFPDQAVLEPKVGRKMKFSFYKKNSEKRVGAGKGREIDPFPEGIIIEFIPNKEISYTWEKPNIPDFPRTVTSWELETIENNKTTLKLLPSGFKVDKMVKEHEGWSYFLNELIIYCEKRE
ncbi:MAG: hypothetical protein DLM72_17510 [Candidatus Nitrosopolaris wilkensis]|nr:MAG: hypothetical protein DLM72_17510 [Candidatus Nitrosopolaris wilkensis]